MQMSQHCCAACMSERWLAHLCLRVSDVSEANALVQGVVAICEPVLEPLLEVPVTCMGSFPHSIVCWKAPTMVYFANAHTPLLQ